MVLSLWDIVGSIVAATVTAASSAVMPIPQGTDYFAQTSFHLTSNSFVTDPTAKGQVLAETVTAGAPVQAFIYNDSECPYAGSQLFYRLYVSNTGVRPVRDVVIEFDYPPDTTFVGATPQPAERDDARRMIIWRMDGLAPQNGYIELSTTVSVAKKGAKTSNMSVRYSFIGGIGQVATTHTVPDNCGGGNSPTRPRPANKQPKIICDPAETSCQATSPVLGPRFQAARPAIGALQLGPRFAEAVADIIPGECRVIADNIISEPGFADAFNREFDPAAYYMDPLYQSGQDFKRLVHENSLLAIPFFAEIQKTLGEIHTKYWQQQTTALQKVLDKKTTTKEIRSQIDRWYTDWANETKQAQQTFAIRYGQLQQQKRPKFDPIAQKATANSRSSIERACNQASDGGVSALLPVAQKAYEDELNARLRLFSDAQSLFSDGDSPVFDAKVRTSTWKRQLREALDAFDRGDDRLLQTYVQNTAGKDRGGFSEAFKLTYTKHRLDDIAADELVRLNPFKQALDAPKRVATACEKEKVFKQPVETTFCESLQGYPELIAGEGQKIKSQRPNAQPFNPVALGNPTINKDAVKGQACSRNPGDPWWSNKCECSCNELVVDPSGAVDENGNPVLITCQAKYPIVRHDINASKAECLAELKLHGDLYF